MTKEHTPTPWKATKYNESWTVRRDADESSVPIAAMWETIFSPEANAAHIVKCVNMHDELVRLLKHVVEQAEESDQWWIDSPDRGGFDISSIKETLKKAGAL